MIPLITLEGPTASGKSGLALSLARELGTEIISADSRQVYRHMDIGTAKPSARDLEAVPHHLIDIIEPDESYNAGRFCADATNIIAGLRRRDRIPLVCGGTGLYVNSLLRGLFPQISIDPGLRRPLKLRLAGEGLESLHRELKELDPVFAEGISANDRQRILRGLEVCLATGVPISEHWRGQREQSGFRAFRILIDPPRAVLYERINARVETMLEQGLLEEIKNLLSMGFDASSPGLNSVGYKEFIPHLMEAASLQDCAALAAQHTRNYAKRQCTWYRKIKFDLTLGSDGGILSEIAARIRAWQISLN